MLSMRTHRRVAFRNITTFLHRKISYLDDMNNAQSTWQALKHPPLCNTNVTWIPAYTPRLGTVVYSKFNKCRMVAID